MRTCSRHLLEKIWPFRAVPDFGIWYFRKFTTNQFWGTDKPFLVWQSGRRKKINIAMGLLIDSAHKGYLDIWLDLGYVGLFLFFSFFLSFFLSCFKGFFFFKKKEYFFGYTFLFIQLIYNFFESSFVQPNHLYWVLLIITTVSYKINTIELKTVNKKIGSQSVINGNILNYNI